MPLRSHPRTRKIAAMALLATAVATPEALASTPPDAAASCTKGRRVQVKPQELKKKVRAVASAAELAALLEPLGMTTEWMNDDCTKNEKPRVVLDVFRARIVSADAQDFVLQARGRVCASLQLLDGVVLHPLEDKNTFCAIGMPFLPKVPESNHVSTTFGFENLTEPVRQVLRVDSKTEEQHSSYSELSYWEAQEGELRCIFSIVSGGSTGFESNSAVVKVSVQGSGFPRELHVEETVYNCGKLVEMPSGETIRTSDCTEVSNDQRQCYRRVSPGVPGKYEKCSPSSDTVHPW